VTDTGASGVKLRPRQQAIAWAEHARRPLVFTNGVFDLLHPGHVVLLERAAAVGASLMVGVNDDASARRLGKGYDRPIVAAVERARMVAAIGCVDCVTLFSEDTPLELIEAIRPDVLVKGGDYTVDTVVGSTFVRGRGGRVEIVPLVKGFSSTQLVGRVRGAS
jgi:D-beta-D-heptose 7-phosphate kinase/D-beta-D-heptose 1-phosphate adenosyltransferase